jgi:amino acid transporter
VVGVAAWLGYLTAIVVVGAMVAVSFGDYVAALFFDGGQGSVTSKVAAVLLVVAAAVMTVAGPRIVDWVQTWIVLLLLAVFAVFVVATIGNLDTSLLAPSTYPGWSDILASVALTFFAFLGFAVISFAAGDLRQPTRELPRAMYGALGVTTLLYVLVAFCVFGTLSVPKVVEYGPTAIAEAARPSLGDAGFTLMAIAALLATASSVTATLYASSGLTNSLAEEQLFPPIFGRDSRLGTRGGLTITSVLTILFVTSLDLGALASVGSAVSLTVFVLVAVGAYRKRRELDARTWLVITAIGVSSVVLVGFALDLLKNDRRSLWVALLLVVLALVVNEVWAGRLKQSRRT